MVSNLEGEGFRRRGEAAVSTRGERELEGGRAEEGIEEGRGLSKKRQRKRRQLKNQLQIFNQILEIVCVLTG